MWNEFSEGISLGYYVVHLSHFFILLHRALTTSVVWIAESFMPESFVAFCIYFFLIHIGSTYSSLCNLRLISYLKFSFVYACLAHENVPQTPVVQDHSRIF